MNDSPCRGCTKRYSACHDSCDLYLKWKEKQSEIKEKIQKMKGFSNDLDEYYIKNKFSGVNKRLRGGKK